MKSIDGYDIYEIFEVHTGEVVTELDHPLLAAWRAENLSDNCMGLVYATRKKLG